MELKEGIKYDQDKPRFDLLYGKFLWEMAQVMTHGAKKYADRNYMGLKWCRVFASSMRHLWQWMAGEECDKETGLSHLAHAGCNCMMLREMMMRPENDNRPYKSLEEIRVDILGGQKEEAHEDTKKG